MSSFCLLSGMRVYGRWTEECNDIRSWCQVLDGDVDCGHGIKDYAKFNKYDITMIELTQGMLPTALNLKRNSSTKVIGLVEGDLMARTWSSSTYNLYIQVLNEIDLVGIINDKQYEIMNKLTNKPVYLIGIPYPLEWALSNKQNKLGNSIIELGSTPENRGGIWTLSVFNYLNMDGVVYPWHNEDKEATKRMSNGRLSFNGFKGWKDYFKEHSQYHIGLHLDDRATWGRFPLDCASADMPCVSTVGSYTQKILFPNLTIEHFEIKRAIELVNKLNVDKGFYQHCIDYANDKIKQFDLEPTKQRFIEILKEI